MATIANVNKEYAYQLQDLGLILEQVNTSPNNDVRDRAIVAAVNYYTRRLPRVKVALITTLAAGFYPVPADWLDISRIVALEYPLNLQPPTYYSPEAIRLQPRENDALYFFPNPNPGSDFRLIYTAAHGATAALPSETLVGSIPAAHESLLGMIAVENAAMEFAARFANSVSSNVDSVDYRSKSKEWADTAKELRGKIDLEMTRAEVAMLMSGESNYYYRGWK